MQSRTQIVHVPVEKPDDGDLLLASRIGSMSICNPKTATRIGDLGREMITQSKS